MTTHEYIPTPFFAKLATTELGIAAWNLLNEKEIVIRMETATELGHPALEAVQKQLLAAFGNKIKTDINKQMLGHMTRQIMERIGYDLDEKDVSINGPLFTTAARYRKRA